MSSTDSIVYVEISKIVYMTPARTGDANTVIFFNKEYGVNVTETVEQIFALIEAANQ